MKIELYSIPHILHNTSRYPNIAEKLKGGVNDLLWIIYDSDLFSIWYYFSVCTPSRSQLRELTIQAYGCNSFRCIERGQVFLIHCTVDQMQSRYLEFHSIPRVLHRDE